MTAYDAAGNVSDFSEPADVTTPDLTPPAVPVNLRAASESESVTLTWNASSDNVAVSDYVVYRDGLPIATPGGTATSYTDDALVEDTLHRYQVTARDGAGNESAASNEVARMIDLTAPTVPSNLRAVSSSQSVALTWGASSDAVGVTNYVVYRDGLPLATLGGTATSYTDNALVGNTLHRYQVTARDGAGNESAKSSEVIRTLVDTTRAGRADPVRVALRPQRAADLDRGHRQRGCDRLHDLPGRGRDRDEHHGGIHRQRGAARSLVQLHRAGAGRRGQPQRRVELGQRVRAGRHHGPDRPDQRARHGRSYRDTADRGDLERLDRQPRGDELLPLPGQCEVPATRQRDQLHRHRPDRRHSLHLQGLRPRRCRELERTVGQHQRDSAARTADRSGRPSRAGRRSRPAHSRSRGRWPAPSPAA